MAAAAPVKDDSKPWERTSSYDLLPPDMSELRVVLLGNSWSGRSSVGNFILGDAVFITKEEPVCCQRVSGRCKWKETVLINTPDLLHPNISEDKLTEFIENCVSLSDPGPHVFLLVLQPEDFTEQHRLRLQTVLENFGDRSFEHSLVLITTPREESPGSSEKYEQHPPLKHMIKMCRFRSLKQKNLELLQLLTRLGEIVRVNTGEHVSCDLSDSEAAGIHQNLNPQSSVPVNWNPARNVARGLRIVLFGKREEEMTTLGNFIMTEKSFHFQRFCPVTQCEAASEGWRGRPLTVVKAPDMFSLSVEAVREEVKKCETLCSPGPNVLLLLVKPSDFTEENRRTLKFILSLFGPDAFKHSMVVMTEKKRGTQHTVTQLLQDCGGRLYNVFEDKHQLLMEKIENIVRENKETFLTFSEEPEHMKPALNLVLCGRRGAGKTSAAEAILGQTELHSVSSSSECVKHQGEVRGRQVSLLELPALYGKPQEEVMKESFRCISLCDPEGVHAFILVLPVGPLTDEDKKELETIQNSFSSPVNDFTMILFTESDPAAPAVVDFIRKSRDIQELLQSCGGRSVVVNVKDKQQISEVLEAVDKMRLSKNKPHCYTTETFAHCKMDEILQLKKNINTLQAELKDLKTKSTVTDAEKFLTVTQTSSKMQKQGLTAQPLEAAKSVRVERLQPTVVKDLLDLYFEKNWTLPVKIIMIQNEQAAIVTFSDPKVVENICIKTDYMIGSTPVRMYPYHESLGTALYGKERPTWKMPDPFSEGVHHTVWKFLLMKKQLKSINDQMRPYFCSVDLDNPEVKLSPLPNFLRQKDLTAKHVENWAGTAQEAFRKLMSHYTVFECPANAPAWKAAEKEVRSVVKEDAYLVLDAPKGALMVAGSADHIKQIKAPVENLVLKAMSQIERQRNGVSEMMSLSPAMFYILKQDGLQNAALNISADMTLSYDEGAQKLTISGLRAEVFQAKAWILERNVHMSKKQLNIPPGLLDFLKVVDPMDMSQDLFTSQGISAIYSIDNKGVLLLGSSDSILAEAESRMKMVLAVNTLDVEDEEVLKLHNWVDLNQQLLDAYNFSKKKTVDIQIHPVRRDKITVAGFKTPVKEVSSSLKEFIANYSRVKETVRVESCAVVQFIEKKKSHDWFSIAKANGVTVDFDPERPRFIIAGARLHVQKAKSCFQELTSTLFTDNFIVDKPGAKKYFQSYGSMFLSTIMTEFSCVVVLRPENQEDDEEEENYEEESGLCYCKVKTTSGVLVSVSKADICSFNVDAVVNAANEELQHIGGLALALLKAAGPQLQKISNDYISKNGKLRPGDAIVTDACNLPCKHVVHAVGPRFSDSDKKTSVSRLKLAVKESLKQAEMVNCSTIALPAISSGVFGFPVDLCAETIAQAVREYCDSPRGPGSLTQIHLVDNNNNTVGVLAKAVNREFIDLGPTMTAPEQAGGKGAWASGGHQRGRGRGDGRGGGGRGGGGRGGGRGAEFHGGQQGNRGGHSPKGHTRPGGHGGHGGHGGPGRMEQTTAEGLKIVLCKGNIQDQTTNVIVNTISENMNLTQGAVSNAILGAAGSGLQLAVRSEAGAATLQQGNVVITDGFKLTCQKIFHAVCPYWDNGGGRAEETLITIIRYCLEEAEKLKMASLSFPAIGTGNLSFPRDVVSRVLLREIHSFSRRSRPRHLRQVAIVVHPSDNQTVDCFTREFKGQTGQRNVQHEAQNFNESPVHKSSGQSQQSSASFGKVSSPSLGVYRMEMGQITLEVSSGDITREASDVIINSSNPGFTLNSGVSKAILDSAGSTVQLECSQIVSSPGYQSSPMILTSAGNLPSGHIMHIVGQNDPAKIKDMVYSVLKTCEENKFNSVAFPALGTGQGRANPSAVADAMVEAVVEFVRKKHPKFVRSVKILIFQAIMMTEFHKSMKRRQGEEVEGKSVFSKIKDTVTSFFTGLMEERPSTDSLVLEGEEFESTEFQLCADNKKAVSEAKKRIEQLIVAEQAKRTITDPLIIHLSQADVEQLRALQRELTVSIRLDKGLEDQEPSIHLEGLTRDVFTAESAVSNIIRRVERTENLKTKALMLSALVEWQFQHSSGMMVPFDIYTNLTLEEALERKEKVKIKINNETYLANVLFRKAASADGRRELELLRKDLKDDTALPGHWDDMKGDLVKLFPLTVGSKEYSDVETELTRTGLIPNIISIERVQNKTLWQSYQLMKKQLEVKNKHTNNEKLLFHGTGAKSIDLINNQGFNRGYAGAHGAMYGNGSYFAVDPAYSAGGYAKPDIKQHKRMYFARVLVGDYTTGRNGMITPPARGSGNAADLYDSVADNTANPAIFVVFNDIQAYPEYLITFT